MKIFITIIIIVALGFGAWKLLETKPDAGTPEAVVSEQNSSVPSKQIPITPVGKQNAVDNANVKILFTGFGPGKKHDGSFSDVRSNLNLIPSADGNLSGDIVVGMNSMSTDNEKVTAHLKKAEFFDTATYPTATFKLTKIVTADAQGGTATGMFTIKNTSKEVTFPFTFSKSTDENTITGYASKFTINMKEFGIDQKFANETIELNVVVPFKK